MTEKVSLFLASLQWTPARLLPQRRQQLVEFFRDVASDLPEDPCCGDILELWLTEYGVGGLLLGNAALFLLGLLGMAAADWLIWRVQDVRAAALLNSAGGLYCLLKFRNHLPAAWLLVLLMIAFWIVCGFQWWVAFLFLVCFANICAVCEVGGGV